jgi:hypothetical protein
MCSQRCVRVWRVVVFCTLTACQEEIFDQAQREQSLVLACYNSPDGVSVTRPAPGTAVCAPGHARRPRATPAHPVPVQSHVMDVCKDECEARVGEVFARFPRAHDDVLDRLRH